MRFCMNLITRGKFEHCLKTEETTPLEPKTKECKSYAPGVGLVKDGGMVLKVFEFNRE